MESKRWLLTLLGCIHVSLGVSLWAIPLQYKVDIMPNTTLPEGIVNMQPMSINNWGAVVGVYQTYEAMNSFLYWRGKTQDLAPVLGGPIASVSDINDRGEIVGTKYAGTTQPGTGSAFVFSLLKGMQYLGPKQLSLANAINNAGQITGIVYQKGSDVQNPVVFLPNGTMIELAPGVSAVLSAINDQYGADGIGQIVGTTTFDYDPAYPTYGACSYIDGVFKPNITDVVCSEGSSQSTAYYNNNFGQITGRCYPNEAPFNSYIYNIHTKAATYLKLCYINAINDLGWVIGQTDASHPNYPNVPFVFIKGTFYNLFDLLVPGSGITNMTPMAINDRGQIIASTLIGDVMSAILLTPIWDEAGGNF